MPGTFLAASVDNLPLISTIAVGLGVALLLGLICARLKISPIVGFLLAGVVVGPYTPGFVGDAALAHELSEIGVVLLMFGVGLHFSLEDLLSVKRIALPGALVQVGIATLLGMAMGAILDWPLVQGIIFGLALSVASTVVLLRALEEQRILVTERGRIAMGWLIVEDILMVLALVLIPALVTASNDAGTEGGSVWEPVLITLGKVALFMAVMLIGGARVIPWLFERIARIGSRELFTLAVLGIALGIAYASAYIFDVSLALGAFFAGMVLNGSELSHDAAERSLPLRDAFAVLFFVAVGMLFNPNILIDAPFEVFFTVLIVVIGKSIAAYVIVLLFGYGSGTALTISASLAQVGEFSFILAALGVTSGIMTEHQQALVLAAALVSITLNPLMFKVIKRLESKTDGLERMLGRRLRAKHEAAKENEPEITAGHTVLVGYGGVGRHLLELLRQQGHCVSVIDNDPSTVVELEGAGVNAVYGNAAVDEVLEQAGISTARCMLVAVPDAFEAGEIVRAARKLNPKVNIVARVTSASETKHIVEHGANQTVTGELEVAQSIARLVAASGAHAH